MKLRFSLISLALSCALSFTVSGCAERTGEMAAAPERPHPTAISTKPTPSATKTQLAPIHFAPTQNLVPPVLVSKQPNKWPEPPPGTIMDLDAPTPTHFELFIPKDVALLPDGSTTLTLHFHGAAWFMIQQHALRGVHFPLIVGNAKAADAVFETDIMKPGVLAGLLQQTATQLQKTTGCADAHIGKLEVSGFSAGYAGVRGVLRLPEFEPRVARVLLDDSLYVPDAPNSVKPDHRIPRSGPAGIGPFLDFARKAAEGKRSMLMEFSTTPSMHSVGPMDCARAVIAALGIPIQDVPLNSIPAARETADYQLVWRADAGNAHFWCYQSPGRPIHLSHVRNQADMWRALYGKTRIAAIPPVMKPRPIHPSPSLPGDSIPLDIGTTGSVTMFIPKGYKVPKDGAVELTVHFHGATWFVIQEHLRRGDGDPIVALELGQGSSVYRRPFLDRGRFRRLLDAAAAAMKKRGGPEDTHIASVNLTSFSAGYGAVREIIKSPKYVALIKRIVLADSSYGSLDETALKEGRRVVVPEHVAPWANFARIAMTGEKTLLMTTSDITPETYAATYEVARAVAKAVGVQAVSVAPGSCPAAAKGLVYPLYMRADAGSFHWWAYRGDGPLVHMTLARHIADDWMALDQHGDP